LKPDPLKRLHLNLGAQAKQLTSNPRTSMPPANEVVKARVESEVRRLSDQVSEGLTRPWETAIRRASISRLEDVNDQLDKVLSATELGAEKIPAWTSTIRVLQWLLLGVGLAGAGWLAVLAGLAFLQMPIPTVPRWLGVPAPTWMLGGGVVLGLLLAWLCRGLVSLSANTRARNAESALREGVHDVAQELIVTPINTELDAYATVRNGLAQASRS
jgi:hypothetical protein